MLAQSIEPIEIENGSQRVDCRRVRLAEFPSTHFKKCFVRPLDSALGFSFCHSLGSSLVAEAVCDGFAHFLELPTLIGVRHGFFRHCLPRRAVFRRSAVRGPAQYEVYQIAPANGTRPHFLRDPRQGRFEGLAEFLTARFLDSYHAQRLKQQRVGIEKFFQAVIGQFPKYRSQIGAY